MERIASNPAVEAAAVPINCLLVLRFMCILPGLPSGHGHWMDGFYRPKASFPEILSKRFLKQAMYSARRSPRQTLAVIDFSVGVCCFRRKLSFSELCDDPIQDVLPPVFLVRLPLLGLLSGAGKPNRAHQLRVTSQGFRQSCGVESGRDRANSQ